MLPFLQKYHAIPATDSGPSWSRCTDDELLDWHGAYRSLARSGWNRDLKREATASERSAALPIYNEIMAEIGTRAAREGCGNGILAAWLCRG